MLNRFTGVFACAIMGLSSNAQTIVNTETLMLRGDSGMVWTAGASGDASSGNSQVVDVSVDAGMTKAWGNSSLKVIGSWNRLAQDGQSIQSSAFAHVRFEVGNVDRVQPFAFTQTSNNDVLLMTARNLVGIGLKRRLWKGDRGWGSVSWGGFWEAERYNAELSLPTSELLRNSVVVSANWKASKKLKARCTAYVQSAFENWADSRAFFECTWDLSLLNQVSLEWNLGIRWDGDPHAGLKPTDLGTTVGLRFGFDG